MDQTQQAETLLTGEQSQRLMQQQVDMIIDKLQPQLQLLILISATIMVVFVIITLINSIYKWRVERAILRMDKNLKQLVDTAPAALAVEQESVQSDETHDTEQK